MFSHTIKSFFKCLILPIFIALAFTTSSHGKEPFSMDTYITENGPFPLSGVKSPYSPLAIPTKMKPIEKPLAQLLNNDYHISSIAPYPQGVMFILSTLHTPPEHPQQVLCILNPPIAGTDSNVPVSRCWLLN